MAETDKSAVKRKNFRIYNTFIFLQKIYSDLTVSQLNELNKDEVETVEEVYIQYLLRLIYNLNKRGLYTEYVSIEDVELESPKGRINIPKSIATQSLQRQKLVCTYDELSTNVKHNQILKTALQNILFNYKLTDKTINSIRKSMSYFNGIDYIDYKTINWKRIIYNNFNIRYKGAISLCEKLNNFGIAERNSEITFEDKLYITFKEFLLNFYKEKFKDILEVDTLLSEFSSSAKVFEMVVSKHNRFIILKTEEKAIIIGCTEFIKDMHYTEFDTQLKEIKLAAYKYLASTGIKPTGVLIHCNPTTTLSTEDIRMYNVDNFMVSYMQVDLDLDYKYIEYKLKRIADVLLNIKYNKT